MARINTTATGHGSRSESYSDGSTIQFNVFPSANQADQARLGLTQQAVNIIDNLNSRLDLQGPCNQYFRSLPRNRTFSQLWSNNNLFINFSPSTANGFFGATHSNNVDVAVSQWALDNHHRWMIAATIVHEVAHTGGAPGGASHQAERAVDRCGFGNQYDPTILGSVRDLSRYLQTYA